MVRPIKTSERHDPNAPQAITTPDGRGRRLILQSEDASKASSKDAELVIATDDAGGSLTLIEEYSRRRSRPSISELLLSVLCAAASLAFAALIYFKAY